MEITLTPNAEELLRTTLARHPGHSPSEIVERALAEKVEREGTPSPTEPLRTLGFSRWLELFTAYSDRIPAMEGETFSREMIYRETD